MGILGGLGRMIQGKPVFEAPQETASSSPPSSAAPPRSNTASLGSKEIPVVAIERSECRLNGAQMEVSCHIKNRSNQAVEIDKIRLLRSVRELDTYLKPGEQKELVVFNGTRPNNHSDDDVYLAYKNEAGDYFESRHQTEFRQEADKTFSIKQFRSVGPIKDI